jgi:hypothetical protein
MVMDKEYLGCGLYLAINCRFKALDCSLYLELLSVPNYNSY